jgi:hypothetical protein
MNLKFSQLPLKEELSNQDIFPILSDGNNYVTPINAIFNFLSGDKLIEVYTSYVSNSGTWTNDTKILNSVYTTYYKNSSNYVLKDSPEVAKWNSNYSTTSSLSSNWNDVSTYVNKISSNFIFSDSTLVPNSSSITNIIAITQSNYNQLTYIDPSTFYVIAS